MEEGRGRLFHRLCLLGAFIALYAVMSELCERRHSCAVLASPDTFKEDPCPTTSKYVEAFYKCKPDHFRTDTACEGDKLDIRCPRKHRMVISAAMFGRVPNGSEICPTDKAAYIRCELSDFVDAVRNQCHNRRNCHLEANETDWGKPCSDDISTYLTVTYACLSKELVKDLNFRSGRRKKKRRRKKKKKKKGKGKGWTLTTTIPTTTTTITTTREVIDLSTETRSEMTSQEIPETSEQEIYEPMEEVITLPQDHQLDTDETTVQDSPVSTTDTEGWILQTTASPVEAPTTEQPTVTEEVSTEDLDSSDKDEMSTNSFSESQNDDLSTFSSHTDKIDLSSQPSVNIDIVTSDKTKSDSSGKSGDVFPTTESGDDHTVGLSTESDKGDKDLVRGVMDKSSGASPQEDSSSWEVSTESGLTADSRRDGDSLDPDLSPPGQKSNPVSDPDSAKKDEKGQVEEEKEKKPKTPIFVIERDLKVLCENYTKPDVRWIKLPRPRDERSIGFIKDWFSFWHFVSNHEEKAWLYFTLGMCGGIIILLCIILIKVCINFRRNIRARLDVSEPTHRHANNHHSGLDTPMLEHSDSIDRIEVVRFSPRSTLRSMRSNSHNRDIVNYYG